MRIHSSIDSRPSRGPSHLDGLVSRSPRHEQVPWNGYLPYGALEAMATSGLFQTIAGIAWLIGPGAKLVAIIRRHRQDPDPEAYELAVVTMPDGARISVPAGGHLTVIGEGLDRVIELHVDFGEQ